MANEVVAQLDSVTKTFGPTIALDNVTLEIRRGELLALLGPNGAGKTSAVRLLLGLSSPSRGTVSVFGGDPRELESRSRTGVMLQAGGVAETLRVREHIALFSSYYPNPLPRAEVLRIARLEALQGRLFRDLSGGEKQRVLFGLAICGNPDLLVLDEPTVGLDVETRRAFWDEIARMRELGRTVLLTTHYLAEADALADRMTVMDRGRVVAEGSPSEIKGSSGGRKIRFRSAASQERIRLIRPGLTIRCHAGIYEILTDAAEEVTRDLLAGISDISELEITGVGLEEAFIALTHPPMDADQRRNQPPTDADKRRNEPQMDADGRRNQPPTDADGRRDQPPADADKRRNEPQMDADGRRNQPPTDADGRRNQPLMDADGRRDQPPMDADKRRTKQERVA